MYAVNMLWEAVMAVLRDMPGHRIQQASTAVSAGQGAGFDRLHLLAGHVLMQNDLTSAPMRAAEAGSPP